MNTQPAKPQPQKYWRLMGRGWRLRCPRCGEGKLYSSLFKMRPRCEHCGLDYNREPGFYLGSIYVNYALTAVLIVAMYFYGFSRGVNSQVLLWSLTAFCLIFPLLFFHHARAIWLAFDQFWDPQSVAEMPEQNSAVPKE